MGRGEAGATPHFTPLAATTETPGTPRRIGAGTSFAMEVRRPAHWRTPHLRSGTSKARTAWMRGPPPFWEHRNHLYWCSEVL